jgi:hypothetical protein
MDIDHAHRFGRSLRIGYSLEAILLLVVWFEVPVLGRIAVFLQIPSIAWALGIPPPSIAPVGKAVLFLFMFVVQGFLLGLLAALVSAVWSLCGLSRKRSADTSEVDQ